MKLIGTLRFRLSLLFSIALTILAVTVLSILLNKVLNEASYNFDEELFGQLDKARDFVFDDLHRDEDRFSYQEQMDMFSKELFDYAQDSPHLNELYMIVDEDKKVRSKITLSDKLANIDESIFISLKGEGELYTVNLAGFDSPFRVVNADLDGERFIYALDMKDYLNKVKWLRINFISATVAIILLGAALAWFIVGSSMKGVLLVSEAADDFGKGDLKRRVNYTGKGSEVEHLVDRFNSMASQMEGLVHEMTEVTNNIAHDLRTPVTRMRGLAENSLHENDSSLAVAVIEECERQALIIDDILDLAQSDSGVLELKYSDTDLKQMIEDLSEIYEPLMDMEELTLNLQLPDKDLKAKIDAPKVQRVLSNLLDNAIKYSQGKNINISLVKNDDIELRVHDDGAGISQKFKEDIFKRFFRLDRSRNTPGSGLGLSLARSYIRLHGGDLILEDTPQGTCFLIRLKSTS